MTFVNSPQTGLLPMELPSMRSAEGSRAKTSQTLASRLVLRVSEAVSGLNTPASLANYDPASCSWRTSQRCLIEGWTVFSATWPRSGMMRGGIAYPLQPLAPLTEGTDCGWSLGMTQKPSHSVPTPTASDHIERRCTSTEMLNPDTNKSMSLDRYVKFWPTPKASAAGPDFAKVGRSATGNSLATAVQMWPTPQASDIRDRGCLKSGAVQKRMARGKQLMLSQVVSDQSGQLNPTWVESLMGFPFGWTDMSDGD
jgi:DNA (cytosine-5)-methyltransferase 1